MGWRIAFAALLLAGFAGRVPSQIRIAPDCGPVSATLTAAGQFTSVSAGQNLVGCIDWSMNYYSQGFTGVSVLVQAAPDNNGSPGAWTDWATAGGTVTAGSNPSTSTSSTSARFTGYFRWNRVTLSSVTGTGKVAITFYGCRRPGCGS